MCLFHGDFNGWVGMTLACLHAIEVESIVDMKLNGYESLDPAAEGIRWILMSLRSEENRFVLRGILKFTMIMNSHVFTGN
jgi:hypothetical protein